jgi:hypothetical protein
MKSRWKLITALLIIPILIFGCWWYLSNGRKALGSDYPHASDSIKIPLKKWNTYFICTPNAAVFEDSSCKKLISYLALGDSVDLENESVPVYSDLMYVIHYIDKGKYLTGYISGKNVGEGIKLQNSSANDEIYLVHYTDYASTITDDLAEGKAEMMVIKNHNIISRLPFKAYSDLTVSLTDSLNSFPGTRFFMINYGLGACDYPQGEILTYYDGRKLDSVTEETASGGEIGGQSYDYLFPRDKHGKKDTITIIGTLRYNYEEIDSAERKDYKESTDTSYYIFKDDRFRKVGKGK